MRPCRALYKCFCFVFRWKYGIPNIAKTTGTQISPKLQGPKYLTGIKNQLVNGSSGEHSTRVQNSISQKRRGHWTLKEFGASYLNQQPVSAMHWPKKTKKSSTDYDVKYIVIEAGMR